ncbi:hypothetical protein BDZ89DRAFT_1004605 [Hymenopellis radicata]|nr:hypothetical protein BDZ89DRAFT_1004605 [Hymenopellis radicata]
MKLLLSGATGAAGSQILRSALADPLISSITILTRRPLPNWLPVPNDNKPTQVVVLPDFLHYPEDVRAEIAGHDAFIWALGCSSVGMSEADYTKVTYDYVVSAVEALQDDTKQRSVGNPFRFVFVSGQGSDPEEKNIQMFRNIKGRTEKYLTSLPTCLMIQASVLRPGYFFPSHPVDRAHTRGTGARVADHIFTPLFRGLLSSQYTPIEDLGRFAVELAKGTWGESHWQRTFTNTEMQKLLASM